MKIEMQGLGKAAIVVITSPIWGLGFLIGAATKLFWIGVQRGMGLFE